MKLKYYLSYICQSNVLLILFQVSLEIDLLIFNTAPDLFYYIFNFFGKLRKVYWLYKKSP